MKSSHQARVLVVVAQPKQRASVETALASTGAKVIFAKNGRDAYDMIHTQRVDVVVADITLQKMDGVVLVDKIRRDEYLIPFIFFFDETDSEKIKKIIHHSLVDSIRRPYETELLIQLVDAALEMSLRISSLNEKLHHLCREAKLATRHTREIISLQKKTIGRLVTPRGNTRKRVA